jgi:hypothetical protein
MFGAFRLQLIFGARLMLRTGQGAQCPENAEREEWGKTSASNECSHDDPFGEPEWYGISGCFGKRLTKVGENPRPRAVSKPY